MKVKNTQNFFQKISQVRETWLIYPNLLLAKPIVELQILHYACKCVLSIVLESCNINVWSDSDTKMGGAE